MQNTLAATFKLCIHCIHSLRTGKGEAHDAVKRARHKDAANSALNHARRLTSDGDGADGNGILA
jgi:hypothetical protein